MVLLKTILDEIKKMPNDLIIVDVQPAHSSAFKNTFIQNFSSYLNEYSFKTITYLYNGSEIGYTDDKFNLIEWLVDELGVNEYVVEKIYFYEKVYGYFRSIMGRNNISDSDIIRVIKYMLKTDTWDSREIEEENWNKYKLSTEIKEIAFDYEDNIYLPDPTLIDLMKKRNSPILIGGGKDECLKEIELLLVALGKNPKLNYKLIYG